MQNFEAALFDVDGTILDTSDFIFQAYEDTLKRFGLPLRSRAEISEYIGISLEIIYELLAPGRNIAALAQAHRDFQMSHLYLSKPFPGARATLRLLKEAGLYVGVVSTRARATVIETLELALMCEYIDYVVALEDVERLKPDPEPVLKALEHVGVKPHNAVMVGDSDVDIIAGKRAGTVTIGAAYGFHGLRIAESGPDYLIGGIEEVIPLVLPEYKDH